MAIPADAGAVLVAAPAVPRPPPDDVGDPVDEPAVDRTVEVAGVGELYVPFVDVVVLCWTCLKLAHAIRVLLA